MDEHASKTIPITPVPAAPDEVALYEIRRKVYPRAVHGWFAGWRWAMVWATQIVFYGLPWLMWNGRQAVLFDLGARKFTIFGLIFWPQDVIYLAVLLILSAFALFLFTAVAGRLWCGYACPQTVYTEIFLWVERKIEGDRVARMRLDGQPLSLDKAVKKTLKHTAWIVIALWTGYTFVGYFTPIRDLALRVVTFELGPWETFWILFYAFATYGNAGWMREQVCTYMCPYARFQGVMFDRDTMIIAYGPGRGEPRGARSRKVDPREKGLVDCVDCEICVQVCPTGIDIRNGLQMECIGCAACIDGCDQVMDRMGYPKGLIRYASENSLAGGYGAREMWRRVFRPRTLVYSALFIAITAAALGSLALRNPLKVDVLRDRGALAREASPGVIENVYRLHIMNTTETPQRFEIRARGVPGLEVVGVEQPVAVEASGVRNVPLRLRAAADAAEPGTHKIEIEVASVDVAGLKRDERSTFILPRP
ncbi:MAG TPA: cytochrome c oxidase accessory protein CcoG [Casimicrobiaceae bacterium]|nr:cytochrome c oxidase accessory protein CcoG [Casimicrobiaceae bacterium]